MLVGVVPGRPTGMALLGYENDTWMFTAFGMAGSEPPRELAEMFDFVDGLGPQHLRDALRTAEPLAEVCRFRYPESRWRRYDKMRRMPEGLLVLGDAICSFNPIFGQGMTVAALEALALRAALADGLDELAQRYFRAIGPLVDAPWQIAAGADLRFPAVPGTPSISRCPRERNAVSASSITSSWPITRAETVSRTRRSTSAPDSGVRDGAGTGAR